MKKLKRVHTGDKTLETLQNNIDSVLVFLQRNPFGGTTHTVEVTDPSVDIVINHGLGFQAKGYIIIAKSAPVDVYDSPTVNKAPDRQLILRATAAATMTLLVF